MAPIHENGELDFRGPAEGGNRIEGGSRGATSEENIVHKNQRTVVQVYREIGNFEGGDFTAGGQIVAVHRDVHRAEKGSVTIDFLDVVGKAAGHFQAAGGNSGKDEFIR
jgi:hypothetical protein